MEKKKLIIYTDIGDTVIDEGIEVRNIPQGTGIKADCIPQTKETMLSVYEQGYTIVMVADGLVQSFHNTMAENGLDHIFSARVISEAVGAEKPDRSMFETALKSIGLSEEDPRYRIYHPAKVLPLVDRLERQLEQAR